MFGPPLYYYSTLFMAACGYIAMIVSYKNRRKFSELAFFYWYPFASFAQTSILVYLIRTPMDGFTSDVINASSTYAFILMEAFICLRFFLRINEHKYVANLIHFFAIAYFITTIMLFFFSPLSLIIIYTIQAIVMVTPGLVYLFGLFKEPNIKDLFDRPYFWIAIGLVFYSSCTLPFYLAQYNLFDKDGVLQELDLLAINAICYGILFLLITRAFICTAQKSSTINHTSL